MAVISANDNDFDDVVLKSKLPVFVDFYADWCGPCKMAEPIVEELSDAYEDKVLFVKVNVDGNQKTSQKYGVMSIPTTVVIKSGEEVGRQTGFTGKQGFEELIKKAI